MPDPISRRRLLELSSVGGLAALAPTIGRAAAPAPANPLELWYEAPAREWVQALPIGNGRIGAMVFGGVGKEELQLNEDTLWAGGPYDPVNPQAKGAMAELRRMIFDGRYKEAEDFANAHVMATPIRQASYQTAGSLFIEFPDIEPEKAQDYRRSLDIDTAIAETGFTVAGVTYRRSIVASPVDQVIAVRITASERGALRCRLSYGCPLKRWAVVADGDELVLSGHNNDHGEIPGALRFESRLKAKTKGGRIAPDGKTLMVEGADELTLYIALATNFRRFDDVGGDPAAITRDQIGKVHNRGFDAVARAATREHQRLFRRMVVDLGDNDAARMPTDVRIAKSEEQADPALAALYFQFGRYLLISSSRPGSQPANLQGLWNDKPNPPWGGKYTININTEMNYWPANPGNLAECAEPLIRMVSEIAETGARTARDMYGARGWVTHHNTDLWRATAPIDGAKFGLWPTGGAWLCTHLWEQYEYDPAPALLARIYPILHGASLFFIDTLQTDPATGHLVTNPSMSPELGHGRGSSLIAGPTMDMQILRDLFDHTVAAARLLGVTDPTLAEIGQARARLLPMRIGAQGQLQEWPEDWDATADDIHHRHVSHLYGLYPSGQIDLDRTPDLAKAAQRSLEIRGDKATGWATAWRINLWARLRQGDRAHSILRFLLGPERTYPNMFDAHPPFQIDGNFGGTAGMIEMLVQNHDDLIHLLPALPSAWPGGRVEGLRTRGGCTIDLSWRDGQLDAARIAGKVAGKRRVRLDDRVIEVAIAPGRPKRLTRRDFT